VGDGVNQSILEVTLMMPLGSECRNILLHYFIISVAFSNYENAPKNSYFFFQLFPYFD